MSGTIIVPVTAENKGLFLIPSTLNGTKCGEFLKAGDINSEGNRRVGRLLTSTERRLLPEKQLAAVQECLVVWNEAMAFV